jgi:hypothetical protein
MRLWGEKEAQRASCRVRAGAATPSSGGRFDRFQPFEFVIAYLCFVFWIVCCCVHGLSAGPQLTSDYAFARQKRSAES